MVQNSEGITSNFDYYLKTLQRYKTDLAEAFGVEYVQKMEELLLKNEDFLKTTPEVFSNQDIIPSNIIRSKDGTLTLIDWERLRKVPNPAGAYNHLIEAHWRFPELQQEMIRLVLEQNQDIPNFDLLFRIDMIFLKYSMLYPNKFRNTELSTEERETAEAGFRAMVDFVKDALDEKGSWQKPSVEIEP